MMRKRQGKLGKESKYGGHETDPGLAWSRTGRRTGQRGGRAGPRAGGRPEEGLGQAAGLCRLSKELGFYSGDNESRCRGFK